MAAIVPNPSRIRAFETEAAFERWLATNHAVETELWIKFHKKGSGLATVVYKQALDVALSWGWIDGLVKSFDERSYLQRFTPRKPKSLWSQVNRDNVARLIAAGRMTEHGLAHVEAAKRDGRWDAAYASPSKMELPEDLAQAIAKSAKATATLSTLTKAERYALAFRTVNTKSAERRAARVAEYVATLASGRSPLEKVSATADALAKAAKARRATKPAAARPTKASPKAAKPAKRAEPAEPAKPARTTPGAKRTKR